MLAIMRIRTVERRAMRKGRGFRIADTEMGGA